MRYLSSTQEAAGHWPQNQRLDGRSCLHGVQLDETGLPILLANALRRGEGLADLDPWPMVKRAASYLMNNGPATPEDRWEEGGGYSPYTVAVEVAALLAAADFADDAEASSLAQEFRETADAWNASVEQWMYVADSDIARALGIAGHYVTDQKHLVSPDALALVRFGLRSPHDPRIRDTITAIDHVLRSDTATGPVWHRFIGDQYGEHEDGSGYDGAGIGRGWPLLAGERAHYEVAAGHSDRARQLARVMVAQTNRARLLPEQVWDAADIPERDLRNGHPTGGAMPLVWAHAEFLKLCRSIAAGCVFDMPPQTVKRYVAPPRVDSWRRPSPRARRVTGHGY